MVEFERQRSVSGASQRSKGRGARTLSEVVNRTLDPLVARQGFGELTLLTQWEMIVGARIGAICAPEKLVWPPRPKTPAGKTPAGKTPAGKTPVAKTEPTKTHMRSINAEPRPATLRLRVEPGFGLDAQHMSGAIIERVNAHLGWRCVGRLSFIQAPLTRLAPKRARPARSDAEARAKASAATEGVEHDALRAALLRLGEQIMSRVDDGKA